MNCIKVLDKVFEYTDEDTQGLMPMLTRIQVGFHLIFCPNCAQEVERFEVCRDILHEFLPPAPGFEDSVMAMIAAEEGESLEVEEVEAPGGFSTRGWVIAGLVMLVSLATAFFGLEFNKVALAAGMSYMLPIGITIGIVLSSYGALFIGSHIKELTHRFGL